MDVSESMRRAERLPDLMTAKEWSEFTGLTVATLSRQRMEGTGAPFVRLGRASVRYPRDRALAWIESLATDA